MSQLKIILFSCLVCFPTGDGIPDLPVLTETGMQGSALRWKYHSGDNLDWALPAADDSQWRAVEWSGIDPGGPGADEWTGIGWFRLRFCVDSSLKDRPLTIAVRTRGAAEIYIDGELAARAGRVGGSGENEVAVLRGDPNPALATVRFQQPGEHVIAVRHSNFGAAAFSKLGGPVAGVGLDVGRPATMLTEIGAAVRLITAAQFAFTGISLAFSLLFGLLYAFRRKPPAHLTFSLLSLGIAGMTFLDLQLEFISDPQRYLLLRKVFTAVALLTVLTAVHFVHSLFEGVGRVHSRILLAVGAVLLPWALIDPLSVFQVGNFLLLFALLDMARVVYSALRRKTQGAWVMGVGLLLFIAGIAYDLMLDIQVIPGIAEITNGYYYGFTGLSVSMAVYLSQSFARTTEDLIIHERRLREEEVNRRVLEAEIARKTKELEDARTLQLSMLPRVVPVDDRFDIGVHMRTASEVGGDYYDFHVGADSLTIVVGDATGHGLKAGMMVAIAKSLFKAGVSEEYFPDFFNRCNRILRQMYLGNLFMAMTLVRIREAGLTVSAAGMPPALLYRSETGKAEELLMKGMPLGAFEEFPYTQHETDLASGDVLLLLTDGLTELFDGNREMFGLTRAKAVLEGAAHSAADDIVLQIEDAARSWLDGRPPEDDITLVVVRVR